MLLPVVSEQDKVGLGERRRGGGREVMRGEEEEKNKGRERQVENKKRMRDM